MTIFSSTSLPQIIILTETWFSEVYQDSIPGFIPFHSYRVGRRSGGVSVFVGEQFSAKSLNTLCFVDNDIEVCTVQLDLCNETIVIIAVYRPHSGTVQGFIDQLNLIFNHSDVSGHRCILAGDFNICLCSDSAEVQAFSDFMHTFHYFSVITKPTRFPSNDLCNPSLLDHIWTNKITLYESYILMHDATDHLPTILRVPYLSVNSNSQSKLKITFRHNCDANRDKFTNNIQSFNWSSIASNNINIYVKNFTNKLNEMYCHAFPLKTKYVSGKQSINPWMTPNLSKLIHIKSKYFNLYRLGFINKSENNYFKNKVKSIVGKSRSYYYKQLFERNKRDIRATWKALTVLINKIPSSKIIKSILWNGIEYSADLDIAEIFNKYFSQVAVQLDESLPISNIDPLSYVSNSISSSLFLRPSDPYECASIIRDIKVTKQGKDEVPIKLFIENRSFLSVIVSQMINQSMCLGIFPESLKFAYLTPIFKKGDAQKPSNYRPISILPFLSKIFEKIMYARLIKFFTDNNLITLSQFGFTKNKSTLDAILQVTESLYDALNLKQNSINIFIDYSKAFDTVNHSILLGKLESYGVRGLPLNLIANYLCDRQQVVRINNSFSTVTNSNIGVPQGSVLGPLLFLVYINDLPNISENFTPTLFADDTTLSFKGTNLNSLITTCNSELQKFYIWSESNRLTINVEKTNAFLFTNQKLPCHIGDLLLNNQKIDFINHCKFLGIILDKNLKFDQHIVYICGKISKSIGILYRIRSCVPRHCLVTLYYSLIYPYILYCLPIWGATSDIHLNPLRILQKRAVRILNDASYYQHTNPLFYSSKILKIDDIYFMTVASYMYKNRERFPELIRLHNYGTRNRDTLLPPFERLCISQQSVIYNGTKIWNSIPNRVKNSESMAVFKRNLKLFLLNRYMSS